MYNNRVSFKKVLNMCETLQLDLKKEKINNKYKYTVSRDGVILFLGNNVRDIHDTIIFHINSNFIKSDIDDTNNIEKN